MLISRCSFLHSLTSLHILVFVGLFLLLFLRENPLPMSCLCGCSLLLTFSFQVNIPLARFSKTKYNPSVLFFQYLLLKFHFPKGIPITNSSAPTSGLTPISASWSTCWPPCLRALQGTAAHVFRGIGFCGVFFWGTPWDHWFQGQCIGSRDNICLVLQCKSDAG